MEENYTVAAMDASGVVPWGALCGVCFSHKSGDPARFYMKYATDPRGYGDGVISAYDTSKRPVASVRVFDRSLNVNGKAVRSGAIGEVCTHPEYRRRGLAGRVMDAAMKHMKDRGYALTYLSAAPQARHLYEKMGYKGVEFHNLAFPVKPSSATDSKDDEYVVRPLGCNRADDVKKAEGLYSKFSQNFQGMFRQRQWCVHCD